MMRLKLQKRLAAQILKSSPKRVRFDTEALEEIKEAITKDDLRGLIHDKVIVKKQKKGIARHDTTARHGPGSRKGKKYARAPRKKDWMNRIRKQRDFLKELKEKKLIDDKAYRMLYLKAKGGFFRSKRHVKVYCEENNLFKKQDI